MEATFDAVIIGAGLAGMSVGIALSDLGQKVCIVDKATIGSGASGVPIGLINPAAAKQANLSWNAKSCIESISSLLKRAEKHSDKTFYRKSGVLRPAIDTSTFEAFKTSQTRHSYPKGWAKWLDSGELNAIQPDLYHIGGALWVNEGFTVDVRGYLHALASLHRTIGTAIYLNTSIESKTWNPDAEHWVIQKSDGLSISTKNIISAVGSSVMDDSDWKWLSVHPIKGQMASFKTEKEIQWKHAISGRGYLAHLNGYDWVVGSTFEHTFKDEYPDEAGLHYLEQKVDRMVPSLKTQSVLSNQWAGIRIGTPNRLPIIGMHPITPGLWVFTGLGSKGLLHSAYLAEILASNIAQGTDIPYDVNVVRLKKSLK